MAPPKTGTAAFAYRDFRRYQMARIMVIMGAEAQAVAVAWQVYEITHRAIDLGYTGLVLFLPGLLFLLPAGHVADRYDRREVILVCYVLQILCTLTLLIFALRGLHRVGPIFAVLFLIGSGRAFSGPASSALLPHLVSTKHFVNAITWGATVFQIANIAGPAVGGLLYTLPLKGRLYGAPIVFLFTLVTGISFVLLIASLHVRPGRMEHRAISADVILAGFRYVWKSRLLLGSISLDLFVVLLGGRHRAAAHFCPRFTPYRATGTGRTSLRPGPRCAGGFYLADLPAGVAPPWRAHVPRSRCLWGRYRDLWPLPELTAVAGRTDGGGGLRYGQCRDPLVHAAIGDACLYAGQSQRGEFPLCRRFE